MKRSYWIVVGGMTLSLAFSSPVGADGRDVSTGVSDALTSIKEDSKRLLAIAKVKAAFADRRDIPGRYIRVRFDGRVLQLAGFVPNKEIAKAAEEVARTAVAPESVKTFWEIDEDIDNREPRKTYVGEQASDLAVYAKVLASLNGPDVRPLLKNAETVHVNVHQGKVTIYIILDAPPDIVDLSPHVATIEGVTGVTCKTVRTYSPPPPPTIEPV